MKGKNTSLFDEFKIKEDKEKKEFQKSKKTEEIKIKEATKLTKIIKLNNQKLKKRRSSNIIKKDTIILNYLNQKIPKIFLIVII